eukprot:5092669-Pleurochrysis_carterae.AAC.2
MDLSDMLATGSSGAWLRVQGLSSIIDPIHNVRAFAVGRRRQLVRGKAEQADSADPHVQAAACLSALPADQGAKRLLRACGV